MALLISKVTIITGASVVIGARREDKLNELAEEIKNDGGSVAILWPSFSPATVLSKAAEKPAVICGG